MTSYTTNLNIQLMDPLQVNKSDTANSAIQRLENAMTEIVSIAMTSNQTLTDSQWIDCCYIRLTGAVPGGGATLTIPARKKQAIIEHAGTANSVTIKTANGIGPTVAVGGFLTVRCDGTDVISLSQSAASYDLGGSVTGLPGVSAVILRLIAVRSFTLPAALTGSRAIAQAAATSLSTFSLKKNGAAAFGTFAFAAAGTVATFAAASSTSFVSGDILTIEAPSPQDATLANVDFMLSGTR